MTAIPTDRIKCPVRKGVTHAPTVLLGLCESGQHGRCPGHLTNGCGCVTACRCTYPGHDHAHTYDLSRVLDVINRNEETSVPLPSPFSVPDPKAAEHPEALVTPPVTAPPVPVPDTWDITPPAAPQRPWITGTGEPGSLEVMVRCFALAAGDLHLSDDGPEKYDEVALAAMLGILRAAVRRAALLDDLIVRHMHETYEYGKHHLPDLGEVNVHRRPAKVHWDTYGTAEAIIEAKMAEREGTLPDDPMEPVRWVLEAAAVDYYRKGGLRALGLDPGDYFTSERGTLAVDVPIPD